MSYVSNEERLLFEKELTTVILYECFSKRKYDALKEYYIDDIINIKDNHKLKYYIEVHYKTPRSLKKDTLIFTIRVLFLNNKYKDLSINVYLENYKAYESFFSKIESSIRRNEFISVYDLKNFIFNVESKIVNTNVDSLMYEELQHDIHAMSEEIKLKLDTEIRDFHIQEVINTKENNEIEPKNRKACLLLSELLLELYGYKFEVMPFSCNDALKRKCYLLLKDAILPCLDYQITPTELDKIIDNNIKMLINKKESKK